MSEVKKNEVKIVTWFLQAKNLIKFTDAEDTYKLSDAVLKASDFVKYPLRKGDKVEVGIKEGVVTFLRKQKSESTGKGSEEAYEEKAPVKEEPKAEVKKAEAPIPEVKKEEVTPSVVGEEKELTIFAVAANKKVVKFLEVKDAGWFQIDEAIQAQDYATIGLVAKNKVSVKIVENKVVSLAKVASEPAESPKTAVSSHDNTKKEPTPVKTAEAPVQAKKEWKPTSQYNDDRQNSIECQAMINSACDVVGRVAASISPAPTANVINSMIRAVAEANYNLLQELKQK